MSTGWKLRSSKHWNPNPRIQRSLSGNFQMERKTAPVRKFLLGMLRGNARSFKSSRQNLVWNVKPSWEELSELDRRSSLYQKDSNENHALIHLISQRQIPAVVTSLEGRARIEERRKDTDSPFVKDLGQFARGLRRMVTLFTSKSKRTKNPKQGRANFRR